MPVSPNPPPIVSWLPPEMRLLVACCRWPWHEGEDVRLRGFLETAGKSHLDWRHFVALCEHHRVGPLVYRALSRSSPSILSVPQATLAALKAGTTANTGITLHYLTEASRLCKLLNRAGIEVRILKGVPLSEQIYRDPALRHVGDIDLLIPPGMEETADRVLLADIYYRNDPSAPLTPRRRLSWRRHGKDYTYRSDRSPFEVDLHWRLFRNPHMPGNALSEPSSAASERIVLGQLSFQVLSAERGFLYLCVHGALDGWFRLKSLVDVAAWWRRFDDKRRAEVITMAREHGVLPELAAALRLALTFALLEEEEVSPALQLQAVRRPSSWILDYALRQQAAQHYQPTQDGAGTVALKRYEFGLREGLAYRLEILRRVLLRPRVWARFDLPDALFPLYMGLSPLEWVLFHRSIAPAAVALPRRSRWHRLRALTGSRQRLLGEAFFYLVMARAALALLPARQIFHWMGRPLRGTVRNAVKADGPDAAESVRWAVLCVARYGPLSFLCFPQALAAHAMLRRRGVASVMHYGVRRSADLEMRAHTWLEVDRRMLLGGESAPMFTPLRSVAPEEE